MALHNPLVFSETSKMNEQIKQSQTKKNYPKFRFVLDKCYTEDRRDQHHIRLTCA